MLYLRDLFKIKIMDPVLNGAKEISRIIQKAIEAEDGALIGRNGTIELEQMISYNQYKMPILEMNAGIFPYHVISEWRSMSIDATSEADVLATGWFEPLKEAEQDALKEWKCQAIQIPLRSLEPYYVPSEYRWTTLLKGQTVSVVSCFTQTMRDQLENLGKLFPSEVFPSDVTWNWVQTGHPPRIAEGVNEWPSNIKSSLDAVDWIVSEVVRQCSRFALIGCGGIGMLVAHKLKERGVIAIVLGGSIQVFFGIKGRRWENHSIISKFWNEYWVSPSEAETPRCKSAIEGGCYW
jgi:hypothetical protein